MMNQAEIQANNPYASFGSIASDAPATERLAFIKRTYMHLMLAIYALVALEWVLFQVVPDEWVAGLFSTRFGWLIVLGVFMAISHVANRWALSAVSLQTQYLGLGVCVAAWSVMLYPLLWMADRFGGTVSIGGSEFGVIGVAAMATGGIFAALTAIVFATKKDFSFLGPALGIAGFAAMAVIVISIIGQFNLGVVFSVLMVAFAAGYILYDTSNVLHNYRTTQHVAASVALFSSVALLFWYVIQIVMAFSSRR